MVLWKLGRRLLSQKYKLQQSQAIRKNADWYRPRFKGGNAEPHELMRFFKQYMYENGEKYLGFFLIYAVSIGWIIHFVLNEKYRKRKEAWCLSNVQYLMNFPGLIFSVKKHYKIEKRIFDLEYSWNAV